MEGQIPKLDVAGSTPVARSREVEELAASAHQAARRRWQFGGSSSDRFGRRRRARERPCQTVVAIARVVVPFVCVVPLPASSNVPHGS